jgi:hypothetical protein
MRRDRIAVLVAATDTGEQGWKDMLRNFASVAGAPLSRTVQTGTSVEAIQQCPSSIAGTVHFSGGIPPSQNRYFFPLKTTTPI